MKRVHFILVLVMAILPHAGQARGESSDTAGKGKELESLLTYQQKSGPPFSLLVERSLKQASISLTISCEGMAGKPAVTPVPNPVRLAIDLPGCSFLSGRSYKLRPGLPLSSVRFGTKGGNTRIVLDLSLAQPPPVSIDGAGDRYVLRFDGLGESRAPASKSETPSVDVQSSGPSSPRLKISAVSYRGGMARPRAVITFDGSGTIDAQIVPRDPGTFIVTVEDCGLAAPSLGSPSVAGSDTGAFRFIQPTMKEGRCAIVVGVDPGVTVQQRQENSEIVLDPVGASEAAQ